MTMPVEKDVYVCKSTNVIEAERTRLKVAAADELTGLAFSGGGIRSASFALGAVEALANRGLLNQFHYLSTVSGGSYLGAAITWLRRYDYGDAGLRQLGLRRDTGARGTASVAAANKVAAEKSVEGAMHQIAAPAVPAAEAAGPCPPLRDGSWLAYLRQHGNYLLPSSISPLALAGIALRGAVVSVAVYFATLLVALGALLNLGVLSGQDSPSHRRWQIGDEIFLTLSWDVESLLLIFVAFFLVGCLAVSSATLVASFGWRGRFGWGTHVKGDSLQFAQAVIVGVLFVAAVSGIATASTAAWLTCSKTGNPCPFQQGATSSLALMGLVGIGLLVRLLVRRSSDWYYALRVLTQQQVGALLSLIILLAILASLPRVFVFMNSWGVSMGNLLTALGAIGAAVQSFVGRGLKTRSRFLIQILALVSVGFVTFGLLLLGYTAAMRIGGQWWMLAAILLVAVLVASATNLNLFNLGRMYRDRLMETFQPGATALNGNCWERADEADTADLHVLWPPYDDLAPRLLPLINCSAVLGDAASDKFRNRGSDSFTLSPVYSGCDATGWVKTAQFADQHMSLATAVATSGAAVNPHAAGGGRGITRDRLVSSLMFLFQVRLGCWVLNPALHAAPDDPHLPGPFWRAWTALFKQRPNFIVPGIWSGLLGRGMNERAPYIELTDGGHFDNTGIYELLRRRCALIMLIQGSADPAFEMEDIGNAIEKARVDFGVEITFRSQWCLDQIRPTRKSAATGLLFADRGFAIADIEYPEANVRPGVLVYVQATRLRGACTDRPDQARTTRPAVHEDVISYAIREPDFPNETTLDQFFNESQLEAYR